MELEHTDHLRSDYSAEVVSEGGAPLSLTAATEDGRITVSIFSTEIPGTQAITLPLPLFTSLLAFGQAILDAEGSAS